MSVDSAVFNRATKKQSRLQTSNENKWKIPPPAVCVCVCDCLGKLLVSTSHRVGRFEITRLISRWWYAVDLATAQTIGWKAVVRSVVTWPSCLFLGTRRDFSWNIFFLLINRPSLINVYLSLPSWFSSLYLFGYWTIVHFEDEPPLSRVVCSFRWLVDIRSFIANDTLHHDPLEIEN